MGNTTIIQKIEQLPRLPKALNELLQIINDDNAELGLLAEKVSHDALISAKLLRLANSARFGRRREIGSIEEAVIRLGIQPLRILVTASAVTSAIPPVNGIDLVKFWGRSFEVAFFCQELGKRAMLRHDTAFTCGLLHNIGELLLALMEPIKWRQVQAAVAEGADQAEISLYLLGVVPAEVAAQLASEWYFSDELVAGLRYQEDPPSAKSPSKLALVLALAKYLPQHWDDCADAQRTSWLAQQTEHFRLRLQMDGLASRLEKMLGAGEETARQLV
ncbi:HDOD domain-containing protein [Shewanella sp.]|jgi:HD-like signal output (HDOD) protein|uniref:HDOD domain-containing protein n=1 Tax=Shewanella sp. TaxID=50422 RepID=UPI003D0D838C